MAWHLPQFVWLHDTSEGNPLELTPEIIHQTDAFETPFLYLDLSLVEANLWKLHHALPDADIHYAIKANSDPHVIHRLLSQGIGKFETASWYEVEKLLGLGAPPETIIHSAPFRKLTHLQKMYDRGVRVFSMDSPSEIAKFKAVAPNAKIFVRVDVGGKASDWPLSEKFGCAPNEACSLLKQIQQAGLQPLGIAFHPGSQSLSTENWTHALSMVRDIYQDCSEAGIHLGWINMGGGFPIQHLKTIPSMDVIGRTIRDFIATEFPHSPKLIIEPGRGLVGDAGVMVAEVVSKRIYKGKTWVYLDVGVFNGLMETSCGFNYKILTRKDTISPDTAKQEIYTIAGPSCDSVDVMFRDKEMSSVEIGDRVYIINAGAYTLGYASTFNGFPVPSTHYAPSSFFSG